MSNIHMAEILIDGYETFSKQFGNRAGEEKVVRAITSCRTKILGGHEYECPECHSEAILYNSCGNRHCPKCQALARRDWVDARKNELLPVPYFHVVFTIPSELNPFALRNKKAFYAIMFRSVNETLQQLGATSKYLGASIGFITVLHTWGQNLMDHPHIHCIVPAGGLSRDGKQWVSCRNSFLFPYDVMKKLFRAKVLNYFKLALESGSVVACGNLTEYTDEAKLKKLLDKMYKVKWVIFAKQPFAGPARVVEYLGNYTHRIAIAESRLVSHGQSTVSFSYKDYADSSKRKIMTLERTEFIRRFLLHVLPCGFMRIRHFGFLSNCNRKKGLQHCSDIFATLKRKRELSEQKKKSNQPWYERVKEQTGKDPLLCKKCKSATMVLVREINSVQGNNIPVFAGP